MTRYEIESDIFSVQLYKCSTLTVQTVLCRKGHSQQKSYKSKYETLTTYYTNYAIKIDINELRINVMVTIRNEFKYY